MATLPSGYVYSTQNNHGAADEKIGGVAIGLTTATSTSEGNPITYAFSVLNQAISRGRNRPIAKSTPGSYNATGILAGGTFAYDQPSTEWTVLRMGTKINGTASNVLLMPSNDSTIARRNIKLRAFGAQTSSAYRAGYFQSYRIVGQRTPWTTAPSGQTGVFVTTTSNSTVADDQAIFVTYMAVPGELVYRDGSKNPIMDEYAARTGN